MRNIKNERVQLYLKNPEFYQTRLVKMFNERDFKIIITYLGSDTTLFKVGREHHISKDRVRQIVAKALFRVVNIYQKNKNNIETVEKEESPLDKILQSTSKFIEEEIKRRYKDLVAENTLLKIKVKRLESTKQAYVSPTPDLPVIEDQGTKGYFLTDIKENLGEGFPRFTKWFEGKTGGIYEGKYYVMKEDFEAFVSLQN